MPSGGVSERRLTELVPFMRELSPCSVPLQKTCDCSQRRLVETVCCNGAVLGTEQLRRTPDGDDAVGLYAKYVLPYIIDVAMRNKETARLRASWIPRAHGEVLEIGIGSGLSLPFYSPEVHRVIGVDPSVELQRMARKKALNGAIEVEFLSQSAEERLPLGDASIDTAVVTWALCSIPNPAEALRQIQRVLKPGGSLIFLEHGCASRPARSRQARPPNANLEAYWRRLPPQSQSRRPDHGCGFSDR